MVIKTIYMDLKEVSLKIPIVSSSRSFKENLFKNSIGGKITIDGNKKTHIHALDNLDLRICAGDSVGLIGHNGSGKSTLLKIMAEIYSPNHGSYRYHGNIFSLLNLNLINLELTGLENIYHVSHLCNIDKNKLEKNLDNIIRACELGDYINLPAKIYSSGMQTRLVTITIFYLITPDILLLDEGIFGPSDLIYRQKLYEYINKVISKSKILVIAMHNLELIKKLCNKLLIMHKGKIKYYGEMKKGLEIYNRKN